MVPNAFPEGGGGVGAVGVLGTCGTAGMVVVPFRSINNGFWYHFGFLTQNVHTFPHTGLARDVRGAQK